MDGEATRKRIARARLLAKRRPEAREALLFFAELAAFQAEIVPEAPLASRDRLVALVESRAPEPLREASRALDESSLRDSIESYRLGRDTTSPRSFFARVLLRGSIREGQCPACERSPQAGCLRPSGDGTRFFLACALCFRERPFPRGRCCHCGETGEDAVRFYEAEELPQVRVSTCETCRRYLHVVRLDVDPSAIPEVDEIAALSLDVWARERGYVKVTANLVGI